MWRNKVVKSPIAAKSESPRGGAGSGAGSGGLFSRGAQHVASRQQPPSHLIAAPPGIRIATGLACAPKSRLSMSVMAMENRAGIFRRV